MRPVKTPPLPSFAGTAAPQLSSPASMTPLIPPPVKVAPPVKIPAQDPQASLQNAFVRPRKEVGGCCSDSSQTKSPRLTAGGNFAFISSSCSASPSQDPPIRDRTRPC